MPWDCFCPKCGSCDIGGMEDDPDLMEKEMDEYRGKTIKCVSCGCSYSFDTGEILICDVCHKNSAIGVQPYTVTIKEDAYSETLKETLEAGTRITVHIAVCQECLDREGE